MNRKSWMIGAVFVLASLSLGACGSHEAKHDADATQRRQASAESTAAADPEVKVDKVNLERLVGAYADEDMGFAFKVDLEGERLRLTVTEGPPFPPSLLIPTSPTRFRWEGEGLAPGLTVAFQMNGGKATTLTVLQPGKPQVNAERLE